MSSKVKHKKVKITCKECRRKFKVICTQDSYDEWHHGEALIEDALHYLSESDRGLLLTHVCTECAGVLK